MRPQFRMTSQVAAVSGVRGTLSRHRRLTSVVAVVTLAAGLLLSGSVPGARIAAARADEVTTSQDNLRTGWDPSEPDLAPVSDGGPVGGPAFGQIFEAHLNGQIYAQPLVVGQVVIVATETNYVYGLNAVTGAVEWSDFLGPAEPASALNCGDLTPDIGITSGPVYDSSTGNVYLVAVVNDGPTDAQPHVYSYAINPQTGAIPAGWPVAIQGSPVNEPGVTFNPFTERQRTSLLLLNGSIYLAFASYCDYQPYAGYVAGVNATTGALTLWSDEAGVTDSQGGIWQSGGGLMSDGTSIFLATGNGVSPPPGPGTNPPPELGDSVVRLTVGTNGALSAADFFSPVNAPALDAGDLDFGSGGPVGLPFGTASYPDLLVQAGKDGRVFLLDRDNLGGREQGTGGTDADVSEAGPYQGLWGHPAAFGPDPSPVSGATSNDYAYYVGNNDVMRYLQFGVNGSGTPVLTDVANSSTTFGYGSGSPAVTSNGSDPASGVVWEVSSPNATGAGAALDAFPASPGSACSASAPCTVSPIWSAPIGTATQFTVPATSDGWVYVGTRDGNLFGFSSPDASPLTASPVNFGPDAVGKAVTETVTMTATSAVTVSGASIQPGGRPFSAGTPSLNGTATSYPVVLSSGDQLQVPVTYTPVSPGGITAALQLATDAANFPAISVSLTGQGTAPGLQAAPAPVVFGTVADKVIKTKTVMISNDSIASETITATRPPSPPFSARLPAKGTVLAPGKTIAVPVSYLPTTTKASSGSFGITASGARGLTVTLTGTGKAAVSKLTAGATSINFGSVALGSRASQTIVLTNSGDLPATVTAATGPAAPFGAQVHVAAGLPISPGYVLKVPVTFTPAGTGTVTEPYVLHWKDAAGSHAITIQVTGTGIAPASGGAVGPPGGGWTFNGSATMSGQNLALTTSRARQAGSAVYSVPQASNGLAISFSAKLAGDGGMTASLLNAGKASPGALGRNGGQFGFGGQSGVAVTLDTGRFAGDPSANFIGIATSAAGGSLHYVATTKAIPNLRRGSHTIGVTVAGRTIEVTVNGKRVLSARLGIGVIPATVLAALTGSTGSSGGSQQLSDAVLKAAGTALPAPGGGWSFNGSAKTAGSAVLLTATARNQAGAVVYPTAVSVSGLAVTFTAQLTGGTGADGLAFSLLNPATGKATSVGGDGAAMGFGGLSGVAVVLGTVHIGGSNTNWIDLSDSTAGNKALTVLQRAEAIPPLRAGLDTVTVTVTQASPADIMTVWLDGEQVLQQAVPALSAHALLAFTGSTGGDTDLHVVRDVAISTAP